MRIVARAASSSPFLFEHGRLCRSTGRAHFPVLPGHVIIGSVDLPNVGAIGPSADAAKSMSTTLARDGYVVVEALLDAAAISRMRQRLDDIAHDKASRGDNAEGDCVTFGIDPQEEGFGVCVTHPLLHALVASLLTGPVELSGITAREPRLGGGHQQLHPDIGPQPVPGVHGTWFIDAFTTANGATRVVPGSHRDEQLVGDYRYSERPHPHEQIAIGPAGSLLVRHAYLWHSGTTNESGHRRRSLQVLFRESAHRAAG